MELDTQQIQKIIPHRYPFLLIDKVLELQPDVKLIALKNVSVNEVFFVGHFPNEKVMPGVLIIEAMAQAGCVYSYYSKSMQHFHGKELIFYLAKVNAKFIQPVVPGDQLILEITTIRLMKNVGFLDAKAFVKDKKVAEAEIGFGVQER